MPPRPLGSDCDANQDAAFACQAELLELFDLLVDVIFCVKSVQGRYVAVNMAFVRRAGRRSKRDVIGRRATDFFSAPLAERYEEQDRQVLASGKPLRDEIELIRRENGTLGWYVTTKLPVLNPGELGGFSGLVSISRDLATPSEHDHIAQSLSRMVAYVRTNLTSTIKVAELAAAAECSPSQLERRIRKTFGVSATNYVLRARVDHAAHLLTETDLPLAEVAIQAGFYDQADFTHRFARLTNETPAQFRARQLAALEAAETQAVGDHE